MFITITTSKATPEQFQEVEAFLHEHLPRLKQQPGVLAMYHYARPEQGDESTIIIWENEEAIQAYRRSELIQEAIGFEQAHHLPSTREGYPLIYPR
ncbi:MAG TPA: antibiotic biosynthesis monooxygenase family protein [Ktedonobacteraceae bacterium]|nr:antibiotic biosynthesis monooxygenase family protein [Ktedonobacteraceae bacterium]